MSGHPALSMRHVSDPSAAFFVAAQNFQSGDPTRCLRIRGRGVPDGVPARHAKAIAAPHV